MPQRLHTSVTSLHSAGLTVGVASTDFRTEPTMVHISKFRPQRESRLPLWPATGLGRAPPQQFAFREIAEGHYSRNSGTQVLGSTGRRIVSIRR